MPVTQKQVDFTVIVVVDKLQSPPAHQPRGQADAVRVRNIGEDLVLIVVVERIHFLIDIGLKQIDPAILIVVGCVYSHSRPRLAECAHTYTGYHSDLFELSLASIGEEKIRNRIVRDIQIHAAIVVQVGGNDAPSLGANLRDPRLFAHVCECSISVVVKEPTRHRVIDAGNAIVPFFGDQVTAEFQLFFAVIDKAAYE